MSDKPIYVNGIFVKQISDKMLIANINLAKFKEFVNGNPQHLSKSKAGDNFLNVKIVKKTEEGKYGDTHFVAVNDYEPKGKTEEKPGTKEDEDDGSSLPF